MLLPTIVITLFIHIREGGKKNKSLIFNLHASCPHSTCFTDSKNIKTSPELIWEVLPLESHFSEGRGGVRAIVKGKKANISAPGP